MSPRAVPAASAAGQHCRWCSAEAQVAGRWKRGPSAHWRTETPRASAPSWQLSASAESKDDETWSQGGRGPRGTRWTAPTAGTPPLRPLVGGCKCPLEGVACASPIPVGAGERTRGSCHETRSTAPGWGPGPRDWLCPWLCSPPWPRAGGARGRLVGCTSAIETGPAAAHAVHAVCPGPGPVGMAVHHRAADSQHEGGESRVPQDLQHCWQPQGPQTPL
mmetsp:Transcript_101888/g.175849  ORF Transcript_101888/g.175849 Transcript_101888/m.175849 type:complete len:219 (-) Transcript_101888:712-1368(-)